MPRIFVDRCCCCCNSRCCYSGIATIPSRWKIKTAAQHGTGAFELASNCNRSVGGRCACVNHVPPVYWITAFTAGRTPALVRATLAGWRVLEAAPHTFLGWSAARLSVMTACHSDGRHSNRRYKVKPFADGGDACAHLQFGRSASEVSAFDPGITPCRSSNVTGGQHYYCVWLIESFNSQDRIGMNRRKMSTEFELREHM
jgi:hypothetical protein